MKTDCYPSKGTIIEKLAWYERQHQAAHLALCKQNVPDDFLAMRIVKLANQRDEARTEADIQSAGYTQCRCDLTRMIEQRDEALAEVEPLKRELAQAISERTPHDYGILRDQRDEARAEVERLQAQILEDQNRCNPYVSLQTQRDVDQARAEVERLTMELAAANSEIEKLVKESDEACAELTTLREVNAELREDEKRLLIERDEARVESNRLTNLVSTLTHRLEEARNASTRPEPSRLEIAAMLKAGWFANPEIESLGDQDNKWWHEQAQQLIDAGKELE